MKTCSKCHIEKDESEFGKKRSTIDGFQYYCKPCKRAYDRKYEAAPRRKASREAWMDKNKIRYKEYKKVYSREYHKKTYIKKPRKPKSHDINSPLTYYGQNKDKIKEKNKKHYYDNIEKKHTQINLCTKRKIENLEDAYIINTIRATTGLPWDVIKNNKDMIEIKRFLIKLKRKIKQHGKTENKEADKQPT